MSKFVSEAFRSSARKWTGRASLALGALVAACASQPAAPTLDGDLLISHVRVLDFSGEAPDVREDAFVLVDEGAIIALADTRAGLIADAEQDASGLTLIPGLTDMHVHVWDEAELGAYLSWGVTRVRNMSGLPFHLTLAEQVEAGNVLGPHLLTTGPILNSAGPNAQVNHQLVETEEEARAAVAWQAEQGFTRLKVYSNLTREAYDAVLEEAEARNLIVTGHTPEGVRGPGVPFEAPFDIAFGEVLGDGFETIEHIESIVWHGLSDRQDEAAARALAKRIAASGVPVTPTLLAYHNLWRVGDTQGAALTRPGTEMLNPVVQQTERNYQEFWANQPPGPAAQSDAFYGRVTKIFQEEGVTLVAGTDAGIFTNVPGLSLVEELGLMVQAGLTEFEALKSATHAPSVVLDQEGLDGCARRGCAADLVLYACDPLADISCLHVPHAMIRDGEWLSREDLMALREAARHHNLERTQENVLGGLAAQGVDVSMLGLEGATE
ncbi:MAG: amidohydrolase family protein [Hyphomonas sp.]|uniref:amidohydrolase family protein n=1 Tax=Hyphomonas sp. TaxID=87 RepID=UPI003264C66E